MPHRKLLKATVHVMESLGHAGSRLWVPFALVFAGLLYSTSIYAIDLSAAVKQDEGRLIDLFKGFHSNPELGFMEFETSDRVASELLELGYTVHQGIGITGVAGVMKNGSGPIVMVRADMDALPVLEETGLDYASTAIKEDRNGGEFPAMHACGHDAHVTWLLGTAKILAQNREAWKGTIILVAQPAEELIEGASAMVRDGLYEKVPRPDILIAGHNYNVLPAGSVGISAGRRMAGTDQLDVTIHGIGGHGSTPNAAKDPIVMGAMAIMGYQTVVSRLLDQYHPAVLTVGAFQSGESNNVIPDSALLKLNLRWYNDTERNQMIEGIRTVTDNVARMYTMPKDRMPVYVMKGYATPVINPVQQVERARKALVADLGESRVLPGLPPVMGSEDFQMLVADFDDVPILFFEVGSGKQDAYKNLVEKGELPQYINHNPRYELDLEAIPVGTHAMALLALEFLKG